MKKEWRPRKRVAVRHQGMVAIESVRPIIETPHFQLLRGRKQLGLVYTVFPSAMHTRFEHSLGVYEMTRRRVRIWLEAGMITSQEGRDLEIFALLHDWRHGPYSHLVEGVSGVSHDELGASDLYILRNEIEKCGASFGGVQDLFNERNPLYKAVKAHPHGTDKLDYLLRDANAAVVEGLGPIERVFHYTYFFREQNGGCLAVDMKSRLAAMALQNFYVRMYAEVYLRKGCVIAERFYQRMIHEVLSPQDGGTPELSTDQLWMMTDAELDACLSRSRSSFVRESYRRFIARSRWTVAVSLRVRPEFERVSGKMLTAFGITSESSSTLGDKLSSHSDLRTLEHELDSIAGTPRGTVMIAPVASPWRFAGRPLLLCDLSDSPSFIELEDIAPAHYAALREMAESIAAIRICVPPEYRKKVASSRVANEMHERLMDMC